MNQNSVLIICPVFNESHNLDNLIEEFKTTKYFGDLLFINSGSTDNSLEKLEKSGFSYISLEKNMGVGNALVQGIKYGLTKNYFTICIIAGNGKMRPKYINELINPIITEGYDFVQGSRYLDSESSKPMPVFRKLMIPFITFIFSKMFRFDFTDATCGYRAFKLELIKNSTFNIEANWLKGYAFEPYFFSNVILDSELKKKEIPVTMDYPTDNKKYTKIKPLINYPALFFPYLVAYFFPKVFRRK